MIFAAGLGTRLKPLTDTMPKAMVPVAGHPLIYHTLQRVIKAGVSEIVVNVHHFANQIKEYLAAHDWGVPVRISDESECLLDTGGGLHRAAKLFTQDERPILIHNVDILSNADLRSFYYQSLSNPATLLVSERDTLRYLLFDGDLHLKGWTNMATGEVRSPFPVSDIGQWQRLAFSGIHCFSPALFREMADWPEKFPIMDFYLSVCGKVAVRAVKQPGLRLLDVGKLSSLRKAEDWLRTGA